MTICLICNSIINNRISREETEKKRNNHNKNMASGNGLSELDVKIKNFVTVDLVAAVRMNETILFVSLREILEGKTNIFADSSSGDVTITLPDILDSKDRLIRIKKTVAGNKVIADGYSSNAIDGSTTSTMTSQWDSMVLVCDGNRWNKF